MYFSTWIFSKVNKMTKGEKNPLNCCWSKPDHSTIVDRKCLGELRITMNLAFVS